MRLAALLVVGTVGILPVRGGGTSPAALACGDEADAAQSAIAALSHPRGSWWLAQTAGAYARFRFHRQGDAERLVTSVVDELRGPLQPSPSPRRLARAVAALQNLYTCVRSSTAPPLATLTVRAAYQDPKAVSPSGAPAGAGVYVRVEDINVGRTGPESTLSVQVPTGEIRVVAWLAPSFAGQDVIAVEPGAKQSMALQLEEGKELVEKSDLRVESVGASGLPTLRLTFVTNDGPATITRIEGIDALNRDGNIAHPLKVERPLETLFTVQDGVIRTSLPALAANLQKQGVAEIRVTATDASDFTYSGRVALPLR